MLETVRAHFPGTIPSSDFIQSTFGSLTPYGLVPDKTMLAHSICSDDVKSDMTIDRLIKKTQFTGKYLFVIGAFTINTDRENSSFVEPPLRREGRKNWRKAKRYLFLEKRPQLRTRLTGSCS